MSTITSHAWTIHATPCNSRYRRNDTRRVRVQPPSVRLISELERQLARSYPEGTVLEVRAHHNIAVQVYWRMRSLLRGVRLLLDAGQGDEALMLCRAMFTESLWLQAFADPHDGDAFMLGAILDSYRETQNLLVAAGELTADDSEQVRVLNQRRQSLDDYRRRHGLPKPRSLLAEKQLAMRFARTDDYLTHLVAHQSVHGSAFAHAIRQFAADDGVHGVAIRTLDQDLLIHIAAFGCSSAIHAHLAVARLLGWSNTGDVERQLGVVAAAAESSRQLKER